MKHKKRIALVGTQGLPSKYGGFETLVFFLVDYLSDDYDITVYCAAPEYEEKLSTYKGAKLVYINFRANGSQSIPFDVTSILRSVWTHDKILVLGASGGLILPLLWPFRKKFIMNFGGLDWKRSKWTKPVQHFLKFSERLAVKCSEHLVSDNEGISNYIMDTYGRTSTLIAYGGDQAKRVNKESWFEKYPFLRREYAFSLARIQSDNNIEMILNAFDRTSEMILIFVGNWNSSSYGREIRSEYGNKENIILLDAVYDQDELNALRSNCKLYIHGHSAGGTNPALVEAMNLSLPIFAFASGFNEFTTRGKAIYFESSKDLKEKLKKSSQDLMADVGSEMLKIATESYQWEKVAKAYAEIFDR